jgi:hypothetical protein
MPRNFWMIVCNEENFRVTRDLNFTMQGLKSQHRRKVQRVESGDRLLFYVTGIRRFTATATLTSTYREDDSVVWQNEGTTGWPYRVNIKPEIVLDESQYIDAGLLAHRLEYVRRWPPENWYLAFQGNLHLLPKNDFFLIEEEMKKLKYGPDYRPPAEPPQLETKTRSRRSRSGARRSEAKSPNGTPDRGRPPALPVSLNPE